MARAAEMRASKVRTEGWPSPARIASNAAAMHGMFPPLVRDHTTRQSRMYQRHGRRGRTISLPLTLSSLLHPIGSIVRSRAHARSGDRYAGVHGNHLGQDIKDWLWSLSARPIFIHQASSHTHLWNGLVVDANQLAGLRVDLQRAVETQRRLDRVTPIRAHLLS